MITQYMGVNSICLPEPNITNYDPEMALIAGYGLIDDKNQNTGLLRMGWVRIFPVMNNSSDSNGLEIIAQKYPPYTGTAPCRVISIY